MPGFCRSTERSIITKGWKFRAFILGFFFLFFLIYIYIFTHTHKYTPKHPRNFTCPELISGQPHVMFVFAGLSFCSRRRGERDKSPREGGSWKEPSEWPPQNIHLCERQRNRKRRCRAGHGGRSLLLTRMFKQKWSRGRGAVLFYLYRSMIHICTSSHRQGTARTVTPRVQGLSVVPLPSRRRCRSEREAEAWGTVVHLFPKEKKQTKPTPKTHTRLSQK